MDPSVTISIVAAIADNGVIGYKNKIPWKLKADLEYFVQLTKGYTIIVGRKTHESILTQLGHSLKNRRTIIVTRQLNPNFPIPAYCEIATSLENALEKVSGEKEVFVIGGAEIYREALPFAIRMYLTKVHTRCKGDTLFPPFNSNEWQKHFSAKLPKNESNEYDYTFVMLERKAKSFVNLDNARNIEQREVMETIQNGNFCPFCPKYYDQSQLMPVIKQGRYWHIRANRWPYENTHVHLLIIHNEHAEKLGDVSPEAVQEFFELAQWIEKEYQITGGAIGLRFGDIRINGASVNHLHAHLISAKITDKNNPDYQPVRFRVG